MKSQLNLIKISLSLGFSYLASLSPPQPKSPEWTPDRARLAVSRVGCPAFTGRTPKREETRRCPCRANKRV